MTQQTNPLKPLRIAFAAQMRSGKDTAVDYLMQKHGGSHYKFADPLYDILHYAQSKCGFPLEKDRQFLQYIGTDWARSKDQDVWLNALKRRVEATPEDQNIFISDARFNNEFELVKSLGFTLVKIMRPEEDRIAAGASHETHASEQDTRTYPGFQIILHNQGTLLDFYRDLDFLVQECISR